MLLQFETEYSLRILEPVIRSEQPEKRVKRLELLDSGTGNLDPFGILALNDAAHSNA